MNQEIKEVKIYQYCIFSLYCILLHLSSIIALNLSFLDSRLPFIVGISSLANNQSRIKCLGFKFRILNCYVGISFLERFQQSLTFEKVGTLFVIPVIVIC